MTEEAIQATGKVTGKMFLYQEPELLTPETHGSMGLTPPDRPYDFVRDERVVPLTLTEFFTAQRHYPIIFSNMENPLPLAVLGVLEDKNLFVDENGQWDPMCWIPMYLRCYPFAFATEGQGRVAVVVDRAAAAVSENPTYPFFDGDKASEHTEALMQLCAKYDVERQKTIAYCQKLKDLELLTPLGASYTPTQGSEPEPLAEYIGIDVQKLDGLPSEDVYELHKSGFLSAIYLQHYSLENWRHLMARREQRSV